MSLVLCSSEHSENSPCNLQGGKFSIGRKCVNYHPSIWGDFLAQLSFDDVRKAADGEKEQRKTELKEEVRRLLENARDDHRQALSLIDSIQRLGVAYHFEKECTDSLQQIYNALSEKDDGDDLNTIALRFRLLRQEGYYVSSDVFKNYVDGEDKIKEATAETDIRSLLSLYEAAHLGIPGEGILDEAISFTTCHLRNALPHLDSPLSTLVEIALELPLRKRMERLQSRYYIAIYQQEKGHNKSLLEFAKLDFNLLQALHQMELKQHSLWWNKCELSTKLPFIRDRAVECYFWILGLYFEPQYSRARLMLSKILTLASAMDDIYDVYGTIEELDLLTHAIQRWDRSMLDSMPDYMKLFYSCLLDVVEKFEEELAPEGKSYRISYFKESFAELSMHYYMEMKWVDSGHTPTFEEYWNVALISGGYYMVILSSLVGMGDVATKEAFEWARSKPKFLVGASIICRSKDDIHSNEREQKMGDLASAIQIWMKESGCTYEEACSKFMGMASDAWKDMNMEWLKKSGEDDLLPLLPLEILKRPLNAVCMIELLYQHRDGFTYSTHETKERIRLVLVDPVPD